MGREPILHPPGSTVSARPSRASSGAQKRMEARICAAVCPGRVLWTGLPESATSLPCHWAVQPAPRSSARLHSTSESLGTPRSRTGRWQSSTAARSGSTLFFAAGTQTVPFKGHPPVTTICSALCAISAAPIPQKDTTGYAKGARNVNPSDSTRVWCVICSSLFKMKPLRPRSGTSIRPPSVANATSPSGRRESILSGEPNRGIFTFPLLRRKAPLPSRPAAS